MDGENNGKPYEQMDDLGGFPPLFLVQHPSKFTNESHVFSGMILFPQLWTKNLCRLECHGAVYK